MISREVKVHAGDFQDGGVNIFTLGHKGRYEFRLKSPLGTGLLKQEKIDIKYVKSVEVLTEENVKKIGGTVGWGIAGGVLLGPVGLLAGLLLGGKGKNVTIVVKFKDGRKLLATVNNETYVEIKSALF